MKRVLMIAYHFPPLAGSSGIQRTLRFAQHLPALGWEPLVLTADARAYERVSNDQLKDIRSGTVVERAFALDTARHLSLRGRYPEFLARPDRWISWWLGAVPKGLAMIRRFRPDCIWSTYPIATAHRIACTLQRLSRLPWIADFRDPMAQDGYPADRRTWRSFRWLEEMALRRAACGVFVTPGAARMYRERYPELPPERIAVIENGYDEEAFDGLGDSGPEPLVPGTKTLVHSGIVYPSERDPSHFFQALRRMLDQGLLRPGELRVRLRASAHDQLLQPMIERHSLQGIVELAPPLPYREALREMLRADGLLLLQASNCNEQIPAKFYEYLRCRRPILGLTDPRGDTAAALRQAGLDSIAPLDTPRDIVGELRRFLDGLHTGNARLPDAAAVSSVTRRRRTEALAHLLDRVT